MGPNFDWNPDSLSSIFLLVKLQLISESKMNKRNGIYRSIKLHTARKPIFYFDNFTSVRKLTGTLTVRRETDPKVKNK